MAVQGRTIAMVGTLYRWCNKGRFFYSSFFEIVWIWYKYLYFFLQGYVRLGRKNLMLVPIAFVNEHIETLHEMDIEYCEDLAKEVNIVIQIILYSWFLICSYSINIYQINDILKLFFKFFQAGVEQIERAAAPNDHPIFIDTLTDIVKSHLSSGLKLGSQFTNRWVLNSHIFPSIIWFYFEFELFILQCYRCPHCMNNRCHQTKTWFKTVCK